MSDENPGRPVRDDANRGAECVDRRSLLGAAAAALAGLGRGRIAGPTRGRSRKPSPGSGTDDARADETRRSARAYEVQHVVADESDTIQFAVPSAWDDVSGTPIEGDPFLAASPDLDGYATSWDVPGIEVFVRGLSADTPGAELDDLTQYGGVCGDGGRQRTRLPGYEFLTQGWFQCGAAGTTFLAMAGRPSPGAGDDARTRPGSEQEARSGDSPNSTSGIVIGAQGVSEQDLGAIAGATHSLVTQPADAGAASAPAPAADPPPKGTGGRLSPGESIEAEIRPGHPGHRYAIDGVAAGDRVRVDGIRSGGRGYQGFYLLEPGEGVGFPSAIDAAIVGPYGTNALTGEPGPFTLSGRAGRHESDLVLASIPGPYPEGIVTYELAIERTDR